MVLSCKTQTTDLIRIICIAENVTDQISGFNWEELFGIHVDAPNETRASVKAN